TTPSLKGYSVETTFRHSGFAQVVVSVAFSYGRAIVFSPRDEFGLDTLSTSPPIDRRAVLFQELRYYPCAAAPDKAERDSPYESSPTSTTSPSLLLVGLPVRWFALYRGSYLRLSPLIARDASQLSLLVGRCPPLPVIASPLPSVWKRLPPTGTSGAVVAEGAARAACSGDN